MDSVAAPQVVGSDPPSLTADERIHGFVRRASLLGEFAAAVALVIAALGAIVAGLLMRDPLLGVPVAVVVINRSIRIFRHLEDPSTSERTPSARLALAALSVLQSRAQERGLGTK